MMPVSKQPPGKRATAALPDRSTMQAYIAATSAGDRDAAINRSQDLIYDAWDQSTARSRVALARKALGVCPLCADAYVILAQQAATPAQARDLYLHGLDAGELALGPEGFKEYAGGFWGFLETRPYMRARHGLALTLLELGEEAAALDHFRAMLRLNPNDNQGIRYVLLARLLDRNEMQAVKALLAKYAREGSAHWLYTRALVAYHEGKAEAPGTLKLLRNAHASNPHVPAILAGTMPAMMSNTGYMTVGDPDEATEYIRECGAAWRATPGAIAWLAAALATQPAWPGRSRIAE